VYRLMYGDDDPWLDIFFNDDGINGVVEAVEGDGVLFSESDWDYVHYGNSSDGFTSYFVIQLEFDLESPVVAATHLRQQLLDMAGSSTGSASSKFQSALIGDASFYAAANWQDDFDDALETYNELRQVALQNAAGATAAIANAYASGLRVLSEGTDVVITIGELAGGEIGLVEAGLTAMPFLSRPVVDFGTKAITRTDAGDVLFRRGGDAPGLDRRALQGADSAQHGMGFIPRRDFIESHIFEIRADNGQISLLVGKAQNTTGQPDDLHAATVTALAESRYLDEGAEYTVMNRSLKTGTGRTDLGLQAGKRPDILIFNRDGTVDLYEIKSPSDEIDDLITKLQDMRAALPDPPAGEQHKIFLFNTDGTPIPIPGEPPTP